MDFIEKLQEALRIRERHVVNSNGRIHAAVLLPIFYHCQEYHLLFTKRTELVKFHKGQICFPGGSFQEEDKTLLETALRETAEEIGLQSREITVLGQLDDEITAASCFIVSPFVAYITYPYEFKLNRHETAEIIEVPIEELLKPETVRQDIEIIDRQKIPAYYYHYKNQVIWGATARIVAQFLEVAGPILNQTD